MNSCICHSFVLVRPPEVRIQVFCIREAATQNLQKLAAEFGPEWAKEHLVPQVQNVYNFNIIHKETDACVAFERLAFQHKMICRCWPW